MPMPVSVCARTFLAATFLLAATESAAAQGGVFGGMGGDDGVQRPVRVVVAGGLTVPSGDFKATHQNGFHYGAMLILNIPGFPIAIRPEVSLTSFRIREPNVATQVYGDFKNTKTVSGLGNIELPLAKGFYVFGGGGVISLKSDTASIGNELSGSNVLLDLGGGYRFRVGERIEGFLEGRFGTASFDEKKFGYSKAQFIPLTFGLVF